MTKKRFLITIFIFIKLSFSSYADNFNYSFTTTNHSSNGGGTWNSILSMTATINPNQTITTSIIRQDNATFKGGYIYIQKDHYEASSAHNIASDYLSEGKNTATITTYSSLNHIDANWIDNKIKIYVRYESIIGGYAWVGPVVIKRTIKTGSVCVKIEPDDARISGGMWRADSGINNWTSWFESGKTLSGFEPGAITIQFKSISGWEPPKNQTLEIRC